MSNEFSQFNLHPDLVRTVHKLGYTEPTPIQAAIIPLMLAGRDVIGQAQTGTGKTAAFALPILHKIQPGQNRVQSLILTPTRELAMQVAQFMSAYGRHSNISVLAVYGGQAYYPQLSRLKRGVDVVVGTPGRLLDLIQRKALDLSGIQTVVLDEADEMLSMGFIDDIEAILQETPVARQTALFSATLPPPIRRLADRYLRDPQSATIERKGLAVATIAQRYLLVNEHDKVAALTRLIEFEEVTSALIFVRTRANAGELAHVLTERGFPTEALHGDMNQGAREQVLNRFRRNQSQLLVATDVAARGLDIDDISHVFNFDLPDDPEVYVHRVGRTGRAGKSGVALTLVTPREQWRLHRIEGFTKQTIDRVTLPTAEEILQRREAAVLAQMEVWLRRGRFRREQEMVADLVEAGHEPWQIAAAALKLARAEEKQRPIAEVSEVVEVGRGRNGRVNKGNRPQKQRKESKYQSSGEREEGMVRLTLSAGRSDGVRPNDVVGAIANNANIPGGAIGAIRIQDQHTLVDVAEQFVAQVLANSNRYRIRKQVVTIDRA